LEIKPIKLIAIKPVQAIFNGAKPKLASGIFVNGIDSIARQAIQDGVILKLLKLLAVVGPDSGINGPNPNGSVVVLGNGVNAFELWFIAELH
jgi:hypothetical protein